MHVCGWSFGGDWQAHLLPHLSMGCRSRRLTRQTLYGNKPIESSSHVCNRTKSNVVLRSVMALSSL